MTNPASAPQEQEQGSSTSEKREGKPSALQTEMLPLHTYTQPNTHTQPHARPSPPLTHNTTAHAEEAGGGDEGTPRAANNAQNTAEEETSTNALFFFVGILYTAT